jgi:pyruvate,water dikinase
MTQQTDGRFPSPFEVETPPGLEGWQELYPYYYLFSEERREFEEGKFWFQDRMHHPEPLYPFDTITCESWWVALGQYNSRVFVVPPALGIDQRVLNGYLYISANAITDPEVVQQRLEYFQKRAGYYYQNWNDLYAKWKVKAEGVIRELEELEVPDLPEVEDESVVTEGKGITSGYYLLEAWDRLIENCYKIWQHHFEFLNLGYAAYLTYYDFCKKAFPDISDQTIAKMVSGIDVILFRPDTELKNLARKALELGVAETFKKDGRPPEEILAELEQSEAGRQWIQALEEVKHPWFYFSTGTGFYHHHTSWIDDLTVPFVALRGYIEKLEQGEEIDRPLEEIQQERDRLAEEYMNLLDKEEDRKAFQDLLQLARTVFPFVEDHNFYVEHWHHTVMWNKVREFGRILVKHGFFNEVDDIFYLHRFEIHEALYDLVTSWAVGTPARGPKYWPPEIERRKAMIQKMYEWTPPPALGVPPEVVTEPFTIMLWGITTETIQDWLKPEARAEDAKELKGFAGSPGVVEGPARVIRSAEELEQVQNGEILVCPITTPSWAPVFTRIQATVTDIGGMMSHAAIVCREYGLPAVVGTGYATQTIKTGQRIRVDGTNGTVTILD